MTYGVWYCIEGHGDCLIYAALCEKRPCREETQAEVLRKALEEYLDRMEDTLPHSLGLGEDEGMSGAD